MFAHSSCITCHKCSIGDVFFVGFVISDAAIDVQMDLSPDSERAIGEHSPSDPKTKPLHSWICVLDIYPVRNSKQQANYFQREA